MMRARSDIIYKIDRHEYISRGGFMGSLVFIIDLSEPAPTDIMFNFYRTIAPNIHPRAIARSTPNMILSKSNKGNNQQRDRETSSIF